MKNDMTLFLLFSLSRETGSEVCVVAVPVLEIPEGELGVLLAVRDASEGGVVTEAAVEHLVDHSLRLLPAHLAYGEDGAQRSAPHALLRERHGADTLKPHPTQRQPRDGRTDGRALPDGALGGRS